MLQTSIAKIKQLFTFYRFVYLMSVFYKCLGIGDDHTFKLFSNWNPAYHLINYSLCSSPLIRFQKHSLFRFNQMRPIDFRQGLLTLYSNLFQFNLNNKIEVHNFLLDFWHLSMSHLITFSPSAPSESFECDDAMQAEMT